MKQNCSLSLVMLIFFVLAASLPFSQAQETSDSWEVEIIKDATNEVIKSGVVHTNSFSLEGLEYNVEYFARVRTKNTFLSDWELSDVFTLDNTLTITSPSVLEKELRLSSSNGQLLISSGVQQQANIYTVDGCLFRSIPIPIGNTTVTGLAKGLYIINGQKIIVK